MEGLACRFAARYSARNFCPVVHRGSRVLPVASSLMVGGAMPVRVEMSAWLMPSCVMSAMSCFQSMPGIVAVANIAVNRYSESSFKSQADTSFVETIGSRIKSLLEEQGVSQTSLAAAIGVRPSHVSEMISGKKDPRKLAADSFLLMCAELSTTPEYLFYGQGEKMDKAQTSKEAELLMLFRTVPDDKKSMLLDILKAAGHSGNDAAA